MIVTLCKFIYGAHKDLPLTFSEWRETTEMLGHCLTNTELQPLARVN